MGSDASRGSTNLSRRRREGDIRKGLASNGCEPKGWRYIGFYERNPHHRKALVLPLFRLPLPIPFPLAPYILPLSFSPSSSFLRLARPPRWRTLRAGYPFKVNSNTSGCDQNGETRTQSTTLSFWGARFECLATKLATAGRRNGRQKLPATFCLPPRLRPFPPHPRLPPFYTGPWFRLAS